MYVESSKERRGQKQYLKNNGCKISKLDKHYKFTDLRAQQI